MRLPSLVGERRALALASLGFFGSLYTAVSLLAPDELRPLLWGLGACYVTAFFALGAGWFWARWFATGIGWSGLVTAAFGLASGLSPFLIFYGISHGLVVVALLGRDMAELYELRPGAASRLGLDEEGKRRLGKTVTRTASALPSLIAFALAPREGQGLLLAVAALAVTSIGLGALVRGRTWGLVALVGAPVLLLVAPGTPWPDWFSYDNVVQGAAIDSLAWVGSARLVAVAALTVALAPIGAPAVRWLRARRRP